MLSKMLVPDKSLEIIEYIHKSHMFEDVFKLWRNLPEDEILKTSIFSNMITVFVMYEIGDFTYWLMFWKWLLKSMKRYFNIFSALSMCSLIFDEGKHQYFKECFSDIFVQKD